MAIGSSNIQFSIADESHEEGIRRLLRETPMGKTIAISMRREPDYFHSVAADGPEHCTIVATHTDGQVACVGSVIIRERFFNGRSARVGYLANLRLASSFSGRFDILRQGYRFFDALRSTLNIHTYFTSVAADNHRAMGLLERGISGLPAYRYAGELVTLLIPVPSRHFIGDPQSATAKAILRDLGLRIICGDHVDLNRLVTLLNGASAASQYAPFWSVGELQRITADYNLRSDRFRVFSKDGEYVGCAALWDQRDFKQVTVERYARPAAILRPLYNMFAAATHRASLPRKRQPIPQGFVSHVALPLELNPLLEPLIQLLMVPARSAGVKMLAIGLDARDPRLPILMRRCRPRLYRTRLYAVIWPGEATGAEVPDGRLFFPEVSSL